MGTTFDAVLPAGYDVEVIESAPEEAYVFERSGSVHSGEVVGGHNRCRAALGRYRPRRRTECARSRVRCLLDATKTGLLLVGRGDAFHVDVDTPERFEAIDTGGPVVGVRPVVDEGLLLLASPWTITALDERGVRWQTGRLAIEGIRLDEVQARRLAGVADPDDDEPRDFVVDLATGCHEGGVPFA